MFLTHDTATANMFKIKSALGMANVSVEYPCYLSIEVAGREFHAGYITNYDEQNFAECFEIYEFTDGYNIGRTIEMITPKTFQELADALKLSLFTLLDENTEILRLAQAL